MTDTKYYLRSSVLGGRVLTEFWGSIAQTRTFVYSGSAILAVQWRTYGYDLVDWEHQDPSRASIRYGGSAQERDPLGGNAGISAQTQISDEGAFTPYGNSYNAADPTTTYTVDGMRVPASDFMAFAGIALEERLLFLEEFVRRTRQESLTEFDKARKR